MIGARHHFDIGDDRTLLVETALPAGCSALTILPTVAAQHDARLHAFGAALYDAGFGVAVAHLTGATEARSDARDVALMVRRLLALLRFVRSTSTLARLACTMLACDAAATPALVLAARAPRCVHALVTVGAALDGDETAALLRRLSTPTLLIVHERDGEHPGAHARSRAAASGRCRFAVMHRGTPDGALAASVAARWATSWFRAHLPEHAQAADASSSPPPPAYGGADGADGADVDDAADAAGEPARALAARPPRRTRAQTIVAGELPD